MLKTLHEMLSKKYVRKFDLDVWSKQIVESSTLVGVKTLFYVLKNNILFEVLDEDATCSMCCSLRRHTKNSSGRLLSNSPDNLIGKPIETCTVCNLTFHLDCLMMNQAEDVSEEDCVRLFNKSITKRYVSIICGKCNEKRLAELAEAEAAEARKKEIVNEVIESNRYAFRVSNIRVKRFHIFLLLIKLNTPIRARLWIDKY